MEDNKDIDDLSQSALENYKMNPPAQAWNALDADLSAKQSLMRKAKRKRFLLLAMGLVFLLGSYITFHYLTPSNNSNGFGNIDNKIQADNKRQQTSVITNSSEVENSSKSVKVKINAVSPSVKKETTGILNADNHSPKQTGISLAMNENIKIQKHNNKFLDCDVKINSHLADKNISKYNTVSISLTQPIESFAAESQILINDSLTPAGKNFVTPTLVDSSIVQSAQLIEITKQFSAGNNTMENSIKNDSVFLNKTKSHWSIAVYYSPDLSKNHLKDNHIVNRDETEFYDNENPVYSYTTGISLRYDLNKKWSITAGAAYSTIAYSINLTEIYAGYNSNNELHYQYPTSCGIIQMPGSDYPVLNEHDSINLKAACSQKVKFIKVPVTARFRVGKNKFLYYSDIGFSANFTIQERAKVTIQNTETTIFNNIDGLKKMNYDFLFGMGVQYNFINGTGIFIEPSFRSAITSLTKNTPVNCYPYSFGLVTGISFHF